MGFLNGNHVLVTGGGSGIGAAIARAAAAEGAAVTLVGRRRAVLEKAVESLPGAAFAVADVTREADCAAMVDTARRAHGPIDIVIANAGAAESGAIGTIDVAHWQRMIDVNLTGAFLTVRAALADVTRASEDVTALRRIVLMSSTAGLKGYPYVAPYVAAKHGVIGLARALAVELAKTRVTVNAVCPGFTESPLLEASIAQITSKTGRSSEDAKAALRRVNPQGRFITPDEIAGTVLWLCSSAAASVTGQAIVIAGGEV